MEMTVRNMVGNVAGMICDGAKSSCALKVASVVGAGIQAVMLALEGSAVPGNGGIVSEDIEVSLATFRLRLSFKQEPPPGFWSGGGGAIWQLPTFPREGAQYHRRGRA